MKAGYRCGWEEGPEKVSLNRKQEERENDGLTVSSARQEGSVPIMLAWHFSLLSLFSCLSFLLSSIHHPSFLSIFFIQPFLFLSFVSCIFVFLTFRSFFLSPPSFFPLIIFSPFHSFILVTPLSVFTSFYCSFHHFPSLYPVIYPLSDFPSFTIGPSFSLIFLLLSLLLFCNPLVHPVFFLSIFHSGIASFNVSLLLCVFFQHIVIYPFYLSVSFPLSLPSQDPVTNLFCRSLDHRYCRDLDNDSWIIIIPFFPQPCCLVSGGLLHAC